MTSRKKGIPGGLLILPLLIPVSDDARTGKGSTEQL